MSDETSLENFISSTARQFHSDASDVICSMMIRWKQGNHHSEFELDTQAGLQVWFALSGQNFNLETMFGVNYMLKPTTSILRVACFRLQGESVLHIDASRGTSDHTQG